MLQSTILAAALSAATLLCAQTAQADTFTQKCAYTPYVGTCQQGCDEDANPATNGVTTNTHVQPAQTTGRTSNHNEAEPASNVAQRSLANS